MTTKAEMEKRIKELEAENEELQDTDWLEQPLDYKPIASYKQIRSIVDCTCGKARIVTKWVEQEVK